MFKVLAANSKDFDVKKKRGRGGGGERDKVLLLQNSHGKIWGFLTLILQLSSILF